MVHGEIPLACYVRAHELISTSVVQYAFHFGVRFGRLVNHTKASVALRFERYLKRGPSPLSHATHHTAIRHGSGRTNTLWINEPVIGVVTKF